MKKKLTIAIVNFDSIKNPLLGAGQAWSTHEVGKRLAKKGHKVTVYTSRYPGSIDMANDMVLYKHIGLGSKLVSLNKLAYLLHMPFVIWRFQGDIILECFSSLLSSPKSPLFSKVPVVGLPASFALETSLVDRFIAKLYKHFISYTKAIQDKLKHIHPSSTIRVIPLGVGKEYLALKQRKPEYILFLGRFDASQKGIDLLLDAYAKIARRVRYPLVLAGHGQTEKKIRATIKKRRLQRKVRLIGPTYGEKKLATLSRAIFVAFPSRSEHVPFFALEALGSGLPLVSFDLAELSWASKSFSLKALPFNTDDYARLLKFACETATMADMRKSARNYARRVTWDRLAKSYEAFFLEIVAS